MKYRYASSALLIHLSLLAAPASAMFVPASRNVRAVHHFANHRERTTRRSAISMFLEGSKIAAASDLQTTDYTKLGTLTVPSVGIGTISWSSDSRKLTDDTYHRLIRFITTFLFSHSLS